MNKIKIGARNLSDKELEVLLPNWGNIFLEIDTIRENIAPKDSEDPIFKEEPEFAKHHNNIFSILGERGAGKTSVQLSLKYRLMAYYNQDKNYKNDTILQLIVPQDMEENSSTIAWIIAYFSDLVEEIEEEYKKDRQLFYYKNDCKTNPVLVKFKDLKKSFFIRSQNYKNNINADNSITEYIEKNGEAIKEDINLSKKFKEFIDEYIQYKKNKNRRNNSEPLIHIFFDDVDISNKKCLMVLETIIRYLSHSNIVVFVAGDYSTFKETITLKYLKDDGLLYKDLLNETFEKYSALEVRQTLAYDYLKKVLSPALRYELKKYSLDEKKEFIFGDLNDEKFNLKNLLKEKLGINFSNVYYEILDSKPRGLMNIYYFLEGSKKYSELDDVNKNYFIKRILNIIVDSSSILNTEKENIENLVEIQNEKIRVNFEKFDFGNFSEKNLLKLYLMIFISELMNEKDNPYEREILSYFVEYFKNNLNLSSTLYSSKEMYDVFLTKSNLIENIELFYMIKNELGNRKIEESDFILAYVENLKLILEGQTISDYFCENLLYNKEKIKRIFRKIESSSKVEDSNVKKELELIFENLCLLDQIKSIIEEPLDSSLDEWKKKYAAIKDKNRYELILEKSWICLNSNFEKPLLGGVNIMDTSLIEKLKNISEDIGEILNVINFLELEFNEKLIDIIELEERWPEQELSRGERIERLEKRKKLVQELKQNYSKDLEFQDFVEISRVILERTSKGFQNILSELEDKIFVLENLLRDNNSEVEIINVNIDKIVQFIQQKEFKLDKIGLLSNIVHKLDFFKRHYILLNEVLKYSKADRAKELNLSFSEIRKKYIEIYIKELNHYLYELFFKTKPLKDISQILDEIDEKIFEIENKFILDKEILLINNKRVIDILKQSIYPKMINPNNYINPMKFLELYEDNIEDMASFSSTQKKELSYIRDFILESLNIARRNFRNIDYSESILDSDCINLRIYITLFKMLLKEKITKEKVMNSKEERLKKLEIELKSKSKLKKLFGENKK